MKNVTLSMLTGLMIAAAVAAPAAQASQSNGVYGMRVSEDARDFIAKYDEGRPYTTNHKAPHAGFDPNGDGVHPAIGPVTDQ